MKERNINIPSYCYLIGLNDNAERHVTWADYNNISGCFCNRESKSLQLVNDVIDANLRGDEYVKYNHTGRTC